MPSQPTIYVARPVERAEENCTCPSDGLAYESLPQRSVASQWQLPPGLFRASLLDGHELIFNPLGSANVVVLNDAARTILDSFSSPRLHGSPLSSQEGDHIIERIVDRLISLQLIEPVNWQHQPPLAQPGTLTAWLHVTNACNLRCAYCYVSKSEDAMDEATGLAAVDAVFRSATLNGFRAVKLKYAGGEATLNFKLIEMMHRRAGELSQHTGLKLYEVVLSNGVALSQQMLDFLRGENIRLMISLDGVGEAHDAQRTFANGRGSFTHVARAIDRAVAHGLLPDLSITVTGRNADHLADAVRFALDRELLFNLNFYRDNDHSASIADLRMQHARLIAGVKAAFNVIEDRLPRRRLLDGMVDRSAFDQPHEYACGAGHNYMVVDQRGGVARCQMEIERTITDVFAADPLLAVRADTTSFQNVPVTHKKECVTCPWRYWCAGGCSVLTYRATGRTDVKSPYCDVYKALYPDALRLEGLRLLKWSEPVA